jgi:hypothetical protein
VHALLDRDEKDKADIKEGERKERGSISLGLGAHASWEDFLVPGLKLIGAKLDLVTSLNQD